MCTSFRALCALACKRTDTYLKVKEDIVRSRKDLDDMISAHKTIDRPNEWDQYRDPKVPKKCDKFGNRVIVERRCSICRQTGHTKVRCP